MMVVFFNDTATTEIYTLSLHDALPIYRPRLGRGAARAVRPGRGGRRGAGAAAARRRPGAGRLGVRGADRKSTRLNSSHANISYAVFCLKKKNSSLARSPLRSSLSAHPA